LLACWSRFMDLPDSLAAANVYIFAAMTSSVLIAARVSPQTKARLAALASAQQLTESAFLKRLVESAFQVMSPLIIGSRCAHAASRSKRAALRPATGQRSSLAANARSGTRNACGHLCLTTDQGSPQAVDASAHAGIQGTQKFASCDQCDRQKSESDCPRGE
jgi:hypothetical protein